MNNGKKFNYNLVRHYTAVKSMKGKLAPSALAGLGLTRDPQETIWILGHVKVAVTMEEEHPNLKDLNTCLKREVEREDCRWDGIRLGVTG